MKTNTREALYSFISEHNPVSIQDIKERFDLSSQMIHRHVKILFEDNRIYKVGKAPRVFYFPNKEIQTSTPIFSNFQVDILDDSFVNFAPNGEVTYGAVAFIKWCEKREIFPETEISMYIKTLEKYNRYKNAAGFIDATEKMTQTFDTVALEKVYYMDFYSIEKYGKTLLGNLMLYAKQTNNKDLAHEVLALISEKIHAFIVSENIDAFAFIPPSIDRKIQLMDTLNHGLKLSQKELHLIKIFRDKPVPQKSLSKKSDRIQNASETIFIREKNFSSDTLLLIDDAV